MVNQRDAQAVCSFQREARESDARKLENAKMWSGQHGGVVVLGEIPVLEDSTVVAIQAAADAGDASAQFAIGVAHETGKTVPQDNALAFMWFCLAAQSGFGGAKIRAEALADSMAYEDLVKGVHMVHDWTETPPTQ